MHYLDLSHLPTCTCYVICVIQLMTMCVWYLSEVLNVACVVNLFLCLTLSVLNVFYKPFLPWYRFWSVYTILIFIFCILFDICHVLVAFTFILCYTVCFVMFILWSLLFATIIDYTMLLLCLWMCIVLKNYYRSVKTGFIVVYS